MSLQKKGEIIYSFPYGERHPHIVVAATTLLKNCGLTPIWGENMQPIIERADQTLDKKLRELRETG